MAFVPFQPVTRAVCDDPRLCRKGKRAWLTPAALRLIGVERGGEISLFLDREGKQIGFARDSRFAPVRVPKGQSFAALLAALEELGAPTQGSWPLEGVDLPPIHCRAVIKRVGQ